MLPRPVLQASHVIPIFPVVVMCCWCTSCPRMRPDGLTEPSRSGQSSSGNIYVRGALQMSMDSSSADGSRRRKMTEQSRSGPLRATSRLLKCIILPPSLPLFHLHLPPPLPPGCCQHDSARAGVCLLCRARGAVLRHPRQAGGWSSRGPGSAVRGRGWEWGKGGGRGDLGGGRKAQNICALVHQSLIARSQWEERVNGVRHAA